MDTTIAKANLNNRINKKRKRDDCNDINGVPPFMF